MMSKTIALAADHGGYELKNLLIEKLKTLGYTPLDLGTNSPESVDYPDMAKKLAKVIETKQAEQGVLCCGTGIGISIAANRFPFIRAALIHDAFGARLCREHNNANVIVFGGRTIGTEVAYECLEIFLKTQFLGERHARRVEKLTHIAEG
ncbi:MAG: ribose 5-phosphate isomerase B [Alphaproteobacteria bacterium]|nr:ribose 5-phosphate isomerase B [Alphaproteobacteria bacterium]